MAGWLGRLMASGSGRRPRDRVFVAAAADVAATQSLSRAAVLGLSPVVLGTTDYPALLTQIADPPPLLWVRGAPHDLALPAVALVGSRAASPYGLSMAARFARDLAAAGIIVVSGLARGIDSAAHHATLAAGGRTVAVLGSGHDRLYPPEHAGLADRIELAGALVSEFPPGTGARPHHFPLRNRIISGLVSTVVVVEAPERSGALITAACALDQDREVLVVPGPVLGDRNRGGHGLIRDGAALAESIDDVLRTLGRPGVAATADRPETEAWLSQLPEGIDFTVDDVSTQLDLTPAQILGKLLELELTGRVHRVGGGRFVRS